MDSVQCDQLMKGRLYEQRIQCKKCVIYIHDDLSEPFVVKYVLYYNGKVIITAYNRVTSVVVYNHSFIHIGG